MQKILLRTLLIAVVGVNLLAWTVEYFSEVQISFAFRFALIFGILFITAIFAGAAAILGFLDTEERNKDPD